MLDTHQAALPQVAAGMVILDILRRWIAGAWALRRTPTPLRSEQARPTRVTAFAGVGRPRATR
jgi:hypothetical protein